MKQASPKPCEGCQLGDTKTRRRRGRSAVAKGGGAPTNGTLDPSRPITFASFKSPAKDQVAQYADVLLVNRYYAWYTDTGQTDIIPHALERDMLVWRRVARPNPHLHPYNPPLSLPSP